MSSAQVAESGKEHYYVLHINPVQAERLVKSLAVEGGAMVDAATGFVMVPEVDGSRTFFQVYEGTVCLGHYGPFEYGEGVRFRHPSLLKPDYVVPEAWREKRLKEALAKQAEALSLMKTLDGAT